MKAITLMIVALFSMGAYSDVDVDLDVSLGSEVGPSLSKDEIMPFVGQVEVGYEVGNITPLAVYGHTSSADINGGVEYYGEFYGVGVEAVFGPLYTTAQVVKYYNNEFEREGTGVQMYEVGFQQDSFRFGAFYENARSGYLERMGLKFGYEFDLL